MKLLHGLLRCLLLAEISSSMALLRSRSTSKLPTDVHTPKAMSLSTSHVEKFSLEGLRTLQHRISATEQPGPVNFDALKTEVNELEAQMMNLLAKRRERNQRDDDAMTLIGVMVENLKNGILRAREAATSGTTTNSEFARCASLKASQMTDMEALEGQMDRKRAEHRSCRAEESSMAFAKNDCSILVDLLGRAKDTLCEAHKATLKTPDPQVCQPAMHGEDYKEWLIRTMELQQKTLQRLVELETQCDNQTSWYVGNKSVCDGKSLTHKLKKDTCDRAASDMDSIACNLATQAKTACISYHECYSEAKLDHETAASTISKQVQDWKDSWTTLEKIACYLNILAEPNSFNAPQTRIDNCNNEESHNHTVDLEVIIPIAPPAEMCGGSQTYLHPCSPAYVQQEYTSLSTSASAPAICTPCPAFTTTIVTTTEVLPGELVVRPMFEVKAEDWHGGETWSDDRARLPSSQLANLKKEVKDGRDSVRLSGSSSFVEWPLAVDARSLPKMTLEVFVYVNSFPDPQGWIAGAFPPSQCMRFLILDDQRLGGVAPSCMAVNNGGYAAGNVSLHEWKQVVAVYDQGVSEYVVVDGLRSRTFAASHGITPQTLRLGTPYAVDHSVDFNIATLRIYDKVLTEAELEVSRVAFLR